MNRPSCLFLWFMAHDSWICRHGNLIPQLQPLEPEAERKGKGLGLKNLGRTMICSWLMLVAGVHGIPHPLFPLHVYFHIPQARSSKAGLASSSSCWLGHTNLGGWPPGCDAGSFFQELHVVKKKQLTTTIPQRGRVGEMPVHAIIHPKVIPTCFYDWGWSPTRNSPHTPPRPWK